MMTYILVPLKVLDEIACEAQYTMEDREVCSENLVEKLWVLVGDPEAALVDLDPMVRYKFVGHQLVEAK